MKKSTLLAAVAAAVVAVPSAAAPTATKADMKKALKHRTELVGKKFASDKKVRRAALRRAEATADWQPTAQTLYEWTGDEWAEANVYETTYTPEGLTASEIDTDKYAGAVSRTTYTYDAEGRIVERLKEQAESEGEPFENYMLLKRAYDPRMLSLIVSNVEKVWVNGGWNGDANSYARTVTRNADGNVTSVEVSTLYDGEFEPVERLFVEYGPDGKASRIYNQSYQYDYSSGDFAWVDGEEYSDIVWLETDGQFPEMSTFCIGANRFKSAKYTSEGEYVGVINVEYDGVNYEATLVNEEGTNLEKYTVTDSFGGYEFSSTLSGEDEGEPFEMVMYQSASYDRWGHELSTLAYESDTFYGETEVYLMEWTRGTIEMAEGKDYPATYLLENYIEDPEDDEEEPSEDEDYYGARRLAIPEMPAGTWENSYRVEYTSWADLSGIGSAALGGESAPVEYFNLQGIRVANPSAGVFIKHQGGKTSKVLIR